MTQEAVAMIPARLSAKRLPGKPLILLAGKTLIQRVYEAVVKTRLFQDVFVLTDSEQVSQNVEDFGGKVIITSDSCRSGTDRILEIRDMIECDVVFNVQGDEPFIDRNSLSPLIKQFSDETVEIASLMSEIRNEKEIGNPNNVKVIVDSSNNALYFSRSVIPYKREASEIARFSYYRHVGVYAFRRRVLAGLAALKPGCLEQVEKLEQLRWLENGYKIKMVTTDYQGFGIDTPEDVKKGEELLGLLL